MKKKLIAIGLLALFSLSILSSAFAQEDNSPQEYHVFAKGWDRVKLAFAFQDEHRLEILNKIAERRAEHYQLLINEGKSEEAQAYLLKTERLMTAQLEKLDVMVDKKQEILNRIYRNVSVEDRDIKPYVEITNKRGY